MEEPSTTTKPSSSFDKVKVSTQPRSRLETTSTGRRPGKEAKTMALTERRSAPNIEEEGLFEFNLCRDRDDRFDETREIPPECATPMNPLSQSTENL
jgi:hypothetical protein